MAKLDTYVKDYLNGNANAFDLIYEETKQSVYLSIYTIIKSKSTIEDLMQDTYLKALDNIDSYKIGTNFKAWISKIAHNLSINYYNKSIAIIDANVDIDLIADKACSPLLNQALSILEGVEKEIFIYHIVEGFKFRDIGMILDMNTKTVFYNYKKAINKIKEQVL